jgi:hypothetical protein
MLLAELFASIRERRRVSAQQSYEAGVQITRRLQELLSVPNPAPVETASPTHVTTTTHHAYEAGHTETIATGIRGTRTGARGASNL